LSLQLSPQHDTNIYGEDVALAAGIFRVGFKMISDQLQTTDPLFLKKGRPLSAGYDAFIFEELAKRNMAVVL
jgi:hypothetical protein